MVKRAALSTTFALCLMNEPCARAESRDPAAAEALFEKGRDAMARKDFDTACSAFEESNRLDPGPGTIGNLALCEEQRGRLASAWELFVQLAGKLPPDDPRRVIAEQHIPDLKLRVPLLTIRLARTAPMGTTVVRDSTQLQGASIGTALPVDPGVHRIVVSSPGHTGRRYAIELRERETKMLVVEPGSVAESAEASAGAAPQGVSTASPQSGEAPRSAPPPPLAWVAFGVGAAGLTVGVITGLVAASKHSTLDRECNNSVGTCAPQYSDDLDSFHTWRTVSTVGYVVGAVGVAGGAVLWLTTPKASNQTATRAWLGPASAGVAGRF